MKRTAVFIAVVSTVLAVTSAAFAFNWGKTSTGNASAKATSLAAPASAAASATSSSAVHISWTAPSSGPAPTGYKVVRQAPSGTVCTVSSPTLSCDDTGLTASTAYSYQVFSLIGAAPWTSSANASASATTQAAADTTPPTAAITFPVATNRYNATGWSAGCTTAGICGTASDDVGVTSVTLTIQRLSDSFFYNGTTFVPGSTTLATGGSTTNWTYALANSKLTDGVSYTVTVTAKDAANNAGTASSTFTYDTTPPTLSSLQMFDTDGNGKVDQVKATFNEALGTYTAGNSPWTLTNVPSNGSLSSVSVSGTVATLTLTEGAGAADTSVGAFTVAMASNANGIKDTAGNVAANIAATAPADKAAPALVSLQMFDTNTNGKVDQVKATFSESLASYSAGNAPWAVANVPSNGALASVAVSGSVATLTLTEGSGAADTSVGTFTVALAASSTGIRDTGGNQSAFTATSPADKAAPILVSATSGGGTAGLMQSGDTMTLTFSEPLKASTVATSVTVAEQRATGNTTLTIPGIINSANISNSYLGGNNSSGSSTGTVTLTNSSKTISIVLGSVTTSGSGVATGTGSVTLTPDAGLTDAAANGVVSTSSAAVSPLF